MRRLGFSNPAITDATQWTVNKNAVPDDLIAEEPTPQKNLDAWSKYPPRTMRPSTAKSTENSYEKAHLAEQEVYKKLRHQKTDTAITGGASLSSLPIRKRDARHAYVDSKNEDDES
jgi:hypothetical protein